MCESLLARRHFSSKETESRIVASLVDRAMTNIPTAAAGSASSAQQGKAQRKKGAAAAAAAASEPGAPALHASSGGNAAEAAREALMAVMSEAPGVAQLALTAIMQKAKAPAKEVSTAWHHVMRLRKLSLSVLAPSECNHHTIFPSMGEIYMESPALALLPLLDHGEIILLLQVDKLLQQLQKLERDLEAAKSAELSARAQAASEAKRRALASAEAEAAGANARTEHAQALGRLSASVKKLEVRTRWPEHKVDEAGGSSLHNTPGKRLEGLRENLSAFVHLLCVLCVQDRCEQLEKEGVGQEGRGSKGCYGCSCSSSKLHHNTIFT